MPIEFQVTSQFEQPDLFYDALNNAHEGLDRDASEALNARLILTLANQIGSHSVLLQCIQAAQKTQKLSTKE